MKRSVLDKLLASTGLILAIALLLGSMVLFWTYSFIHEQVSSQLSAQRITFPTAGSKQITTLPTDDSEVISKYAGQQLTNGLQAKAFADNYIAVHLKSIGGGKTYAELSADSMADPTNQALTGQVGTVFRGEALRGMLLNAYAFDSMATVAYYAAIGTLLSGIVVLFLALLGFRHVIVASTKPKKR